MADLTKKERQTLWEELTDQQREALTRHKKYQLQSMFLTAHFLEADKWQFVDFKEDPHYPNGEEKLYCRCGRQVKYQFILLAVESGELLALGSTHFAQHLGVSEAVAAQVRQGLHTIDRGTDLILRQVAAGLHFPKHLYRKLVKEQSEKQLPAETQRRLAAFAKADLPIYEEDQQSLLALAASASTKEQGNRPWQPRRQPGRSGVLPRDNPVEALIAKIRQLEIGELVPSEEWAVYLGHSPTVIRRWLGLLEANRFSVQVKQVAGEFFRIR